MSQKIILSVILILLLSLVGLLGFNYFQYSQRSAGTYFATLPDGKSFPLTYLDRPNVSTKALLSWATLAATATYTLDFVNYKTNLENLKSYFTDAGFENFLAALTESGTITTITEKKLVLSAVAIGPAIVLAEDEVRGNHVWKIEVPITVSYLSASAEEKRDKLVTLTITQVPTIEASKGIGIAQYVAIDLSPDIMG